MANYKEFFQKHLKYIKEKNICCENCGDKLKSNVSEIAHILPKNYFKSIAENDENILYLCGMYSKNQCHSKFDDSKKEVVQNMKVFKKAKEKFEKLETLIKEKIPYKTYNKWEK